MNDPIIQVENLSKLYQVGAAVPKSLRQAADQWWDKLRGKSHLSLQSQPEIHEFSDNQKGPRPNTFWALKNISFSVNEGEVVGIVGRNGAGKSTLLKILSHITEPTSGRAILRGRVASLLEVGTGFHPDLTGRENVYLNGAILGMRKWEINRKFKDIVEFAEVEKFIDTPVKHYSSGMYVRLAFAVAAHLDPEILLVDEVLAVGDVEFRKKCLGKMEGVAKQGRTVLFVSHDMSSLTQLCGRGILLDRGSLETCGDIASVVMKYMSRHQKPSDGFADLRNCDRLGSGEAKFCSIELLKPAQPSPERSATFAFDSPMIFKVALSAKYGIGACHLAILISTEDGIPVHEFSNWYEGYRCDLEPGSYVFRVTVPHVHLYPGSYTVSLWFGEQGTHRIDYVKGALSFQVIQTQESGMGYPLVRSNALVAEYSEWHCEKESKR